MQRWVWGVLAMAAGVAAGCDGSGATAPGEHFAGVEVAADEAALGGRVVDFAGDPVAAVPVMACGDTDCPAVASDERGWFLHQHLAPVPRRLQIAGIYDGYGSVVFRREFDPGALSDTGELVLPRLQGEASPWDPQEAGTVLLAGGRLELSVAPKKADKEGVRPEVVQYPAETTRFEVQAGRVPGEQLPPFYNQPWRGREEDTLAFSVVPFDLRALAPVTARVLDGVTRPQGTVYDIYQVDPLDGLLLPAGTAKVDAEGVLVADKQSQLRTLTFFMFVPRGD